MRYVDRGSGTPVVMCHGFPGLWYSFRHQIPAIADAGYRAVAVDMRGYGRSLAPADSALYSYDLITEDLVALLDELGAARAVLIGHDFGGPAVCQAALRIPDRVAGVVMLSAAYDNTKLPVPPTVAFGHMAKDRFLHLTYFQAPGVADAELNSAPREFLHRLFWALSGEYKYSDIWRHPAQGNGYLDVLPEAPPLPWPWLTPEDLDYYVEEFTRTGFTGGLNWYRAMDVNWESMVDGALLTTPALYIVGENDVVATMLKPTFERLSAAAPDLRGVHVIAGAGHWVQQEAPEKVNELILGFLDQLSLR